MSYLASQKIQFLSVVSKLSSGVSTESLTDDSRLFDIGFDSARSVDLLMALEDEFQVIFDDNELALENMQTVGGVWDLLAPHLTTRPHQEESNIPETSLTGATSVAELVRIEMATCLQMPAADLTDDSDFFDLGGHSLIAIALVEELCGQLPLSEDQTREEAEGEVLTALFLTPRLANFTAAVERIVSGSPE